MRTWLDKIALQVGLGAACLALATVAPNGQTASAQSNNQSINQVGILDCERTGSSGPGPAVTGWSGSKGVAPILRETSCAEAVHEMLERGFDLLTSDAGTAGEENPRFISRYVFVKP
jgi:hypothetical protein